MFQYQIRDLRKACDKLLKRERPPLLVGILQEHADYLGIEFRRTESINEVKPSGLTVGMLYGSIVMVRLIDLYNAVETAVGIDDKQPPANGETGGARNPDSNRSEADPVG